MKVKIGSICIVHDNMDRLWAYHEGAIHLLSTNGKYVRCESLDDGVTELIKLGYITPDPLQKALDAIEEVWAQSDVYIDAHDRIDTRNIIRTLYEEATK